MKRDAKAMWCSSKEKFVPVRYLITFLTVITAITAGYALWQVYQHSVLPDVHIIGSDIYDGGTIAAGATLAHTFRIENPHPFALSLEAPEVGCTCTTATVSTSIIPPHGASEVTLHVEPEDGKFTGSASIVTTHGNKRAETWLFITGKGSPEKTQAGKKINAE